MNNSYRCISLYRWIYCRSSSGKPHQYKIIYRWPTMRHFRLISRLKTYQVGVMILSLPPLSYWYHMGTITGNTLIYGFLAAGGALVVLCSLSYSFSKVVGEIGYDGYLNTMQLSHLSFFGKRRNIEINVDRIIPFHDSQSDRHNPIHSLRPIQKLEFDNKVYYYSLRYGNIVEPKILKELLSL